MPTVAAGGGHILNIDFCCCKFVKEATGQRAARKDKITNNPSDNEEENEEGEQGEETIPKQGKAASVAEALADTQAELEALTNLQQKKSMFKIWSPPAATVGMVYISASRCITSRRDGSFGRIQGYITLKCDIYPVISLQSRGPSSSSEKKYPHVSLWSGHSFAYDAGCLPVW